MGKWETIIFGNIAEFKNGINFSAAEKSNEHGIKTIDVFNMFGRNITVNIENLYKVDKKIPFEYLLKNNDILFVRSSLKREGVGWTSLYKATEDNITFCGFIIRARIIQPDIISEDFLTFYFRSDKAREKLISGSGKLAITNINQGLLKSFEIPLPPLPEQRKIAAILSTVQKAIEIQTKLIERTTELKKTMMNKLFTEGICGEKRRMTEIGLVPESWEVVKLEPIVNFNTGKLNSNASKLNGKYPFFTCSQETFWIDTYAYDLEAILLSGNNARAIYSVKYYKGKFNAYQRTYIITIKDIYKLTYSFLKHALTMKLEWLRTVSIGSQTKYLTLGILQNLLIPLPQINEQTLIGNAIDSVDNKIKFYSNKKQKLDELFRALLHQLMTAEIRVNDLDLESIINKKENA